MAVVTSSPLATDAALHSLRAGGTAVDAALAASVVLAVVEPHNCGVGGDCYALVQGPDHPAPVVVNGTGRAPGALGLDRLRGAESHELPPYSVHSVTVPGAIAAWYELHQRHGRRPWAEAFAPAVALARDGFAVGARVARDWQRSISIVARDPDAAGVYLHDTGRAPTAGEQWSFPALGQTLAVIAGEGPSAFYQGSLTAKLLAKLLASGRVHVADDFAAHETSVETAVETEVHGHHLWQGRPNCQGVTTLLLAALLTHRPDDMAAYPSVEALHWLVEAARLAATARSDFLADPAAMTVPLGALLDPAWTAALAARIDAHGTAADTPIPLPPGSHTAHIAVADSDGLVVSMSNSLYSRFGSGLLDAQTGVLFHNRGCGFTLKAGHPNVLAGAKRPLHTLTPAMVTKDGRPALALGAVGGLSQPVSLAYVLDAILAFGISPEEAVALPRVWPTASGTVQVEQTLATAARRGLEQRGHRLEVSPVPLGFVQALDLRGRDRSGKPVAVCDPRSDGRLIGQ